MTIDQLINVAMNPIRAFFRQWDTFDCGCAFAAHESPKAVPVRHKNRGSPPQFGLPKSRNGDDCLLLAFRLRDCGG
jgi:hypothetical protein